MKTPEEIHKIKEALECCAASDCTGNHGKCDYDGIVLCASALAEDAKAYIEQLEAQIESTRKPMQKPLDLRPDNCPLQSDDDGIALIFVEHRYTKEICAGIYDTKNDDCFFFYGQYGPEFTNRLANETRGLAWRCWEHYPNKEEREAAPWKEVRDEWLSEEEYMRDYGEDE